MEENIIEQLRNAVQNYIKKVGADSEFSKKLIFKIEELQNKLGKLNSMEKSVFLHNMKDFFEDTIAKVESKLQQHANFEHARNYSMFAAGIFVLFSVFILFGYMIYKSVHEKELIKSPNFKQKHAKIKKSN